MLGTDLGLAQLTPYDGRVNSSAYGFAKKWLDSCRLLDAEHDPGPAAFGPFLTKRAKAVWDEMPEADFRGAIRDVLGRWAIRLRDSAGRKKESRNALRNIRIRLDSDLWAVYDQLLGLVEGRGADWEQLDLEARKELLARLPPELDDFVQSSQNPELNEQTSTTELLTRLAGQQQHLEKKASVNSVTTDIIKKLTEKINALQVQQPNANQQRVDRAQTEGSGRGFSSRGRGRGRWPGRGGRGGNRGSGGGFRGNRGGYQGRGGWWPNVWQGPQGWWQQGGPSQGQFLPQNQWQQNQGFPQNQNPQPQGQFQARNATYHVTDDLEYPEVYVEPTPQQSQRNRGNGIWNFTTICMIVALICFPVVSGLTAVNCLKTANPRLINLPDLSDCSLSHQGVRWTAKVYERNENFKKVPSFHCSVEQVRACRRAYLGIFESGEATPSVPDEISAEECRHAVEKGTIENRKLIGRSQHFWSTDQDDSPTTPWWGERCVEVRRFEVTEGEACRGQDEIILTITPGLAPLDKNEIRLYNGITVWGDLSETKCDYKFIKLADVLTDYSRVYLQELGWIDGLTSEEPVEKCEQIGYETSGGLFIVRENGKQKREAPPNGKAIALPQIAFEYNPLLDPEFDLKKSVGDIDQNAKALHRIGNQVEQVNGSTFYRISRAWQQIEAWNKTWIEKELADFYNYQKNQNVVGRLRELERKVEDARLQANTPAPETITTTISSKLASEEATRAKTLRDIIQRLEKLEAKEDPIPPNTAGLELKLKEMMKRLEDQKTVDDNLKELIQELREQLDLLATPEPQASIHDPFEVECNRQAEELRYWKLQLAVNPTYASRKLLGKANLLAQMIDENRFIVSECQTIELTESIVIKTQRVEERCFAEVPIKHEGEIKFLKVPEMDIVPNGTEISCRGMRIAPAVLYMDFKANNAKKPLGNSNLGKRMARQGLSDGPRKWVNTPIQWMKDIQSKYRQTTDGAGDLIDEVKNYTRTVVDKAKDTAGQAMEKGKVVLKDALAEVKNLDEIADRNRAQHLTSTH
ncbi:unnamed protein product, partial [Mesorhabditis spiculigera]